MRKLSLALLIFFCALTALAQDDLAKTFDSLTKNRTGIPYGNNKATGKYYHLRGINMYAESYGKGQPLLLIHGNGGSITHFVHQLPYFSQQYKVIVADSRAHGKTADAGDSLSYEMMADDYAALLDAMKIDSVYVIGWSDGGINALLLAMRHPKKVKKLAITGANLWPDTTAVYHEVVQMVRPPYQSLKSKDTRTAQEQTAFKLLRLLVEEPRIATSSLQKISVPVMVMGGDHDVIKPEHTMLIARSIPQSYLWILPNSGHSVPIVYRDQFNRAVSDFFARPYRKLEKEGRFF
ncbi:MAG TPA: alpha/beta hydrolase [Flavipsychrobacter sp.]|nr:alpha/beta hydrolase [Flavipsychrobacter sp.]